MDAIAKEPLYRKGDWRMYVSVVVILGIHGACFYQTFFPDPKYLRPKVAPHRPIYEGREEMVTPAEQDDAGDWDGCTGGVHPTC